MKPLAPELKSPTGCKNKSYYFGKVTFNMSKITSGERVAYTTPRPINRVMSETMRSMERQLDMSKILERICEDDNHAKN